MKKILMLIWRVIRPILKAVGFVLRPVFWLLDWVVSTYMGNGLWKYAVPLSHRLSGLVGPLFGGSLIASAAGEHLVTQWATSPVAAVLVISALAGIQHKDYLCTACAANFPLDAQREADEHMHHLKRYHRNAGWMAGSYLVLMFTTIFFDSKWFGGYGSEIVFAVLLFTLLLPIVRWGRTHSRLQPWCPWCRRGRGGGDDGEFEPVAPDPHGRKEPVS